MFSESKLNQAFTLVEVLLYLGLFSLIVAIIYPVLITTLTNYLFLKGKIDLNTEVRNIFLGIQKELLKSKSINILTDWEVLFEEDNETVAFFLTQPIYLDPIDNKVKGYANNLAVGSILLSSTGSSPTYSVTFSASSSCSISSSIVINSSTYALSGYAWSPNIGWIKFRNESGEGIVYGVCEDANHELRGYAWNDIIGWISFNCKDIGATMCGTSNYKIIENNNYLYGYAWNDVIGWLIFDGKGGRIYLAKKNPYPYYVDLISDPRIFVKNLQFSQIGNSFKIDIEVQGPGNSYLGSETAIVLPFK